MDLIKLKKISHFSADTLTFPWYDQRIAYQLLPSESPTAYFSDTVVSSDRKKHQITPERNENMNYLLRQ